MGTEEFKWADSEYMPNEDTATVRVVVENRTTHGHRYCFTHFPVTVTLDDVIRKMAEIHVFMDGHWTVDVEQRKMVEGHSYNPVTRSSSDRVVHWVHVKRLLGPPLSLVPDYFHKAMADMIQRAGIPITDRSDRVVPDLINEHEFSVPITNGVNGPVIGKAENVRINDNGDVVADFFIEKDKMPKQSDWRVLDADKWMLSDGTPPPHTPFAPKEPVTLATPPFGSDAPIPDGPAKTLRLLLRDFEWGMSARTRFIENVKLLIAAIESGQLTLDPLVVELVRAGVVAKLKEYNW